MADITTGEALNILEQYINERKAGEHLHKVLTTLAQAEQREGELQRHIEKMTRQAAQLHLDLVKAEQETASAKSRADTMIASERKRIEAEIQKTEDHARNEKARIAQEIAKTHQTLEVARTEKGEAIRALATERDRLTQEVTDLKKQIEGLTAKAISLRG